MYLISRSLQALQATFLQDAKLVEQNECEAE